MPEDVRISGFSFARNATKLYYPLRPAVESILPIVDEFVVALGRGDADDRTREDLLDIGSPKVRILDTDWDLDAFPAGTENAHQTDIAKAACSGDWCFYLQADEVVHEDDLPAIHRRCAELRGDPEVEGLLFRYKHFWGDYWHLQRDRSWYSHEIRIVRNDPDIHSWRSAQSFRRIPAFDGHSYRQKEGTHKLKVAPVAATINHYGWVRPPRLITAKRRALSTVHKGASASRALFPADEPFDFGPMNRAVRFEGSHPAVMADWIAAFDWGDALYETGPVRSGRAPFKHETWRSRTLTFLERKLLGGRRLFGPRNYRLLRR